VRAQPARNFLRQQKTSLSAQRKSSFPEGNHHAPQALITSGFVTDKF
jgi:hypothetical protein